MRRHPPPAPLSCIDGAQDSSNHEVYPSRRRVRGGFQRIFVPYHKKIAKCLDDHDFHGAFHVLEQLREEGIQPSLSIYAHLIGVCARKEVYDLAETAFHQVRKPNLTICNLMMKIYARQGNQDKMFEVLQRMKDDNIRPSDGTRFILLSGLVGLRRLGLAERVFRTIAHPRRHIYNTILEGRVQQGQLEGALHLLQDMDAQGYQPDSHTYRIMLKLAQIEGLDTFSERVLQSMKDGQIPPSERHLHFYLRILCKKGRVHEAITFLNSEDCAGLALSDITLRPVLESLNRAGQFQAVEELFARIERKGITPTSDGFSILITSYMARGQIKSAAHVLKTMETQGVEDLERPCGLLASGCIMLGEYALGLDLLCEYSRTNTIRTIAPYIACVRAFIDEGYSFGVHRTLSLSKQAGFSESGVEMYDCVLQGCVRMRNNQLFENVLQDLYCSGVSFSTATITTLLAFSFLEGNEGNFNQILASYGEWGAESSFVPYALLCVLYWHVGKGYEALYWYSRMHKDGLRPDRASLHFLAEFFGACLVDTEDCGDKKKKEEEEEEESVAVKRVARLERLNRPHAFQRFRDTIQDLVPHLMTAPATPIPVAQHRDVTALLDAIAIDARTARIPFVAATALLGSLRLGGPLDEDVLLLVIECQTSADAVERIIRLYFSLHPNLDTTSFLVVALEKCLTNVNDRAAEGVFRVITALWENYDPLMPLRDILILCVRARAFRLGQHIVENVLAKGLPLDDDPEDLMALCVEGIPLPHQLSQPKQQEFGDLLSALWNLHVHRGSESQCN